MSVPLSLKPNRFQEFRGLNWRLPIVCSMALAVAVLGGCKPSAPVAISEVKLVDRTVELACGECQFKMPGNGCDLAIRFDGKAYFVDGSSIDDHGDAHAEDGLCNAILKAKVTGTVRDGRFESRKIELVNE